MSNTNYQQCTKALFLAVAVSMVASFISFIALKNLEFTWLKFAGFANAAALVWYFISLGKWKGLVNEKDVPAVQKLWFAALLQVLSNVVAIVASNASVLLFIGLIQVVAFGIAIFGYMGMKDSKTMPEGARSGASLLFWAQILVVATILLVTSLPGALLYMMYLAYLGMNIYGWWRIANANPEIAE